MEIDPALLAVIVCPLTRTPLLYVPAAGAEPACLLSEAGRRRYPIDAGIPVLLIAEAVELSSSEIEQLRRRAAAADEAGRPSSARGRGQL